MQTFSFLWSEELGEAIKAKALEQCPEGYRMTIKDNEEYQAIARAWNMGIENYLEALTQRSEGGPDGIFKIHPEELHTLVRRLMEDDSEIANSLASSICQTLDIELV